MLCLAVRLKPDDGTASPSIATIAGEAGVTGRGARKMLGHLKALGVLAWEQRRDAAGDMTSSQYRFPLLEVGNSVPYLGNSVPDGRELSSAQVGNSVPPGRELSSPKTTSKQKLETGAETTPAIRAVFAYYCERVQPGARLCPTEKIRARLKRFSVDELKAGIDHFAADAWWMETNATRGAAWFFHSDERAEQFLTMQPRARPLALNGAARSGAISKQAITPADVRTWGKYGVEVDD